MDLAQLRAFIAITRSGSFRGAAELVHLSQPSLSHQIRRLESELGVRLFDRSQRPVALTEPGRVLLDQAEAILDAVEQTTAKVRDVDRDHYGRVSIGALQYLAHLELPDLLATFPERYPNADMHLRMGHTSEVLAMLIENEVDVALIYGDDLELPAGFSVRKLRTERLVIITALDDPLTKRKHLKWRDLADEGFIMREGAMVHRLVTRVCSAEGFTPKTRLETADIATAVALVSRGLGIRLVPEPLAKAEAHRVAHMHVGDAPLTWTLVLAWNTRSYQSRALRAFMSLAIKFLESPAQSAGPT